MIAFLLQVALEVQGIVLVPGGKPLAGALIQVGSVRATTDAKGAFRLALEHSGDISICAPGYQTQTRRVEPGQAIAVMLQLEAVAVVEVVEGSGYGSTEGTTSTLNRMDIYTTPGAAADAFQAVKGLPGVSNTSEGDELFVRGGKPDEVGIYLNGGRLLRPFHHPNTQGGIFTTVDTAMVTHLDFVPGGFSVRYGDALSAVVDLSTEVDLPTRATTALVTLPTQGIQADRLVGPGLLRGSVRHSDPVLLDKWYGLAPNFQESPVSYDGQLNWQQELGPGRVQVTLMGNRDHLATDVRIANQRDTYTNRSNSTYANLQWHGALSETTGLNVAFSRNTFNQIWSFGPWGIDQSETSDFTRVEFTRQIGDGYCLEGGVDGSRQAYEPEGQVPFDLANWNPPAAARTFNYAFDGKRGGAYLTWRGRFGPKWGLSLGGRSDHYDLLGETTRDLRGTLSFLIREGVTFRAAWGTFHQAPTLQQLDPHSGNSALPAQRATHALLAFDATWGSATTWNLRVETYRKDYDHLVLEDPLFRYTGEGRGYAQGVDLLVKASLAGFRGWIGYGYLDTKRREGNQEVLGTVPTSVPQNLTAVGTWTLRAGLELAASWRYASGAPVTPILGGRPNAGSGFDPLEGGTYADRLPAYGRSDLRLTRLFAWKGVRIAAFGEVMNLLNRHNASSYSYSSDFSVRKVEESYFSRRILVMGASINW